MGDGPLTALLQQNLLRVQSLPVVVAKPASAWDASKALRARMLVTIYTSCCHSQSSLIFSHAITITRVWLHSLPIGQKRGRLWKVIEASVMAEVKPDPCRPYLHTLQQQL